MKKIINKTIDMEQMCSDDLWETTYEDCSIICNDYFHIKNAVFINCVITSPKLMVYGRGHQMGSGFDKCKFIKTTIKLAGSPNDDLALKYNECLFRHSTIESDDPIYGIGLIDMTNSVISMSRITEPPNKEIKWSGTSRIRLENCFCKSSYIDIGGDVKYTNTNTEGVLVYERYKRYYNQSVETGVVYI